MHYYKVRACILGSCSQWSDTVSAYPKFGAEANGPYFALTGQSIMLNGTALYPLGTANFFWNIDLNNLDMNSTLQNPVFTFNSKGTFNVSLKVSAQNGIAFAYTTVTVTDDNSSDSSDCPYYDKETGQWVLCPGI